MKDLLQKQFSQQYDHSGREHKISVTTKKGDFALVDEKSCGPCITFFSWNCGHETFIVHSESDVEIYGIEEFINGFHNIKEKRCDVMLLGDNKLALVDLYCGKSDYIEPHYTSNEYSGGKRATARRQIESTILLLFTVEDIKTFINGIEKRVGIFASRSKDNEMFQNVPKVVTQSANKFLLPQKEMDKRKLQVAMPFGFKFVSVSYPNPYIWDE